MTTAPRSRVVVVQPYWTFWESAAGGALPARAAAVLDRAVVALSRDHDVVAAERLDGAAGAAAAIGDARAWRDAHAMVVLCSMAAPPGPVIDLLSRFPDLPVVVWAAEPDSAPLPGGFDHSGIAVRGATVGAPMVSAALARRHRYADIVLATLDRPVPALTAVRRAAAAGRVRRARILRVGDALAGYGHVVAPDGSTSPPVVWVDVTAADLREQVAAVPPGRVDAVVSQVRSTLPVSTDVGDRALAAAAGVECALRDLVARTGAVAGVLNCHGPDVRGHPDLGLAPCLALGRLTSDGIPWACTGDAVVAVAMLLVAALGRPTFYHEIEAVDHFRDEVVLANTGEHDLRLPGGADAEIVADPWFADDPVPAACARFSLPAGPASLVAWVPGAEPAFVVAEGEFTGRRYPGVGTVNGAFRFSSGPVAEAWGRWAASGVGHHSVATDAHVADDVRGVARHLGVRLAEV